MSVSAIILTKDEGYNLVECVDSLKKYLDEIIVIDSSDSDLDGKIALEMGCKVEKKKISSDGINGFSDLRNFGMMACKNDWCLHVDVDELFSDVFLKGINEFINKADRWAYKFPRINLPWYELYPDYQVRLVNKKKVEWVGDVHEKVDILEKPFEIGELNEYPIIHKKKENKLEINVRWNEIKKEKDVFIVSLFNNCEMWVKGFLENLEKMINYSVAKNIYVNVIFIEGGSDDNTFKILDEWVNIRNEAIEKRKIVGIKYNLVKMEINDSVSRFERLAILRNMGIKFCGVCDYVLMIDSDIIFNEDLLIKMIDSVEKNGVDVIASMVYINDFKTYGSGYFYDILAFKKGKENFSHFYPYVNGYLDDDVIEVDSVGTCYLVRGDVYNLNDFEYFNIVKCYKESKKKILCMYDGFGKSEQIGFFQNVKGAGYKVAVDKRIEILHINLERYGKVWH